MYHKVKTLAVATLFPILYFICQLLVQVLFLQGVNYYLSRQNGDNNGEHMNIAIGIAGQKIYILTFCSAIICFLILTFINKIRKQRIFEHYKKMPLTQGAFYVVLTFGLYIAIIIMNGMLIGFFPEYNNEIMNFFKIEQPFLGIIVIGIIAPLIEELIFRGEVYRELDKSFSTPMVVFLQAVLFGLIHPIPLQKIQTFIMGIFFGYARAKTENIWAPTIMHITNNMIACVLVFTLL